ncbi:MAG: hypothetical protein LAO24_01225 [Acidobacteriia bacterium]|nr:hypothetical protein [Terriglobia bacterium]
MSELDAAAARWQKQIKAVDIEKMKVDYAVGSRIERARTATLENLKMLRDFIGQQRSIDLLSVDILIENSVGDASSPLSALLDLLPANEKGVYWERTLAPMMTEIADLQEPLGKHINAFANKLQLKAEACRK